MLTVDVFGDARAFGQKLFADLQDAERVSIAVAFAKQTALPVVDLEAWCYAGKPLRFLAGTDYALTELQLLRRLEMTARAECRIYHSFGSPIFHPKLYVLERRQNRVVYVGSSNFTRGGLSTNVEVNVRLEAPLGTPEVDRAKQLFDEMFDGEFATPILPEFESGYRELQATMQAAASPVGLPEASERFRIAEGLFLGRYRARVAVRRWLLVLTPQNYEICMRRRVWGRQQEHEAKSYSPGDIFFFHVTGGRGIAAVGIFTGAPFYDPHDLWPPDRRGNFPWRIRLLPLGELRTGIPTRQVLEPLRAEAPGNWFQGFIQQSHELTSPDFDALYQAFERAMRIERLGFGAA